MLKVSFSASSAASASLPLQVSVNVSPRSKDKDKRVFTPLAATLLLLNEALISQLYFFATETNCATGLR